MSSFLKSSLVNKILKLFLGEYLIFRVYGCERESWMSQKTLVSCDKDGESKHQIHVGNGEERFEIHIDGVLMSKCSAWYGEKYKSRNYWPLKTGDAKLLLLETVEEARGIGIGPRVLVYATNELFDQGFERLYARIWHTNKASLRAFQKSGWNEVAVVFDVFPFGRSLPYRVIVRNQHVRNLLNRFS